jgi:hypothetical protein
LWVALIAGIAVGILCCALEGGLTLHPDPYAYASAAGEVLDGKPLYSDVWQDKPPLGLLAYAVPQLFARGSPVALGIWLGLVLAVQALLVIRALGREHREAATAAALVLVLYPATRYDFAWLSTDHVSNVGAVGLLLIAWRIHTDRAFTRRRVLAAAAIAAVCFLVRQTSVVFVVPTLVAIATCPTSWRARLLAVIELGAASLATLIVLLVLCLPVMDLRDCLYTLLIYPMRYASESLSLDVMLRHELGEMHAYAPIALFLIAIWSRRWRPVTVVAVCSVAAALLPHKPYYHYLEALLPMLAFTVFVIIEMPPRWVRWIAWAFVAWLFVACVARAVTMAREPMSPEHRAVDDLAAAIVEIAGPGDTVLFGLSHGHASYLYFVAAVPSASPFYLPYQVDGYQGGIMPVERERVLEGYRTHPPSIIVLDTEDRARSTRALVLLATALASKPPFRLIRTVGRHRIYRR